MRHNTHRYQLGVTKEHRASIMASLSAALFRHDRIETTLTYAKALRPFAEKIITLAKKASLAEDKAVKLHYYRLALAQVRDESAVKMLFSEKVAKFAERKGGYTRIYKLVERVGDASPMALIELIEADDKGYSKEAKKPAAKKTAKKAATKKTATKKTAKKAEGKPAEEKAEEVKA
ncbi:MAG: 50S ribosomal protein L17 [Opitutales bacterium]|nr:50S ribosomal protein L17 [Opitutales bacterium]